MKYLIECLEKSIEMCKLLSELLDKNGIKYEKAYRNTKEYEIGQDKTHIACYFPLEGFSIGLNQLYLSITTAGFWDLEEPFYEFMLFHYDENEKKKFLDHQIRTEELNEIMNCIEEIKLRFLSEK